MSRSLTDQTVMVTGGAGFIGSHLCERLCSENIKRLVVVDNLYLGKTSNLSNLSNTGKNFQFYELDCTSIEQMRNLVINENVDVIFNLAVIPLPASLENPFSSSEQNTAIALVACELLREKHYKTLLHFSSSEAYGTAQYVPMNERHPLLPTTPYAASKASGDLICLSYEQTFNLDIAIVRPFNNFGPRQNEGKYRGIIPAVVENILNNEPVNIHGDGLQTRDLVFVKDTVEAAIRVYKEQKSRGKVINICSGNEVSVNDLVSEIIKISGRKAEVIHSAQRPADVRRHYGDCSLLEEVTGFRPKSNLTEKLQETVDWYVSLYSSKQNS